MTLSGHPMIRAVEEACNFHNRIRDWSRSFGTDVAIWILFGFRLGHRNSNPEDDLGRSHVNALRRRYRTIRTLTRVQFRDGCFAIRNPQGTHSRRGRLITTTFTRAKLLPSPAREEIINNLKAFVAARIDLKNDGR